MKQPQEVTGKSLSESDLGRQFIANGRTSRNDYFLELQKLFELEGKTEEEIDIVNEINEGRRLRIEACDSKDKGESFFQFYLDRIAYYKDNKVMGMRKLHLYIKGVFGQDLGTEAIRLLGMNPEYRQDLTQEAKSFRDSFSPNSPVLNEMTAKHIRERAFQIRDEYGLRESAKFAQEALMIEAARILINELQKGEAIDRGR